MKIDSKMLKLAIHHRDSSFSERWIITAQNLNIDYILVNCYSDDIITELKKNNVTHLMWHINHSSITDLNTYPNVFNSAELMGIKVFPNFNSNWHFDNKISQKYLLESIGAPLVETHVFYEKKEALKYIEEQEFPIVSKLKRGAGATNVNLLRNMNSAKEHIDKMFGGGISSTGKVMDHLDQKIRVGKQIKNPLLLAKKIIGFVQKTKNENKFSDKEKGYVYFQKFMKGNTHDTRIIVIGEIAFAIIRLNRENDFRASGSGKIDYDYKNVDVRFVKEAFRISKRLKTDCLAYDFIYDSNNEVKLVEVCFGFNVKVYDSCQGYWTEDLIFKEGEFNPQEIMLRNLINCENR